MRALVPRQPLVGRGGDLRRLRIVSEPVTEYVRYEYEMMPVANLAAGEVVRWLPRDCAPDLKLPGNDFWLIDDELLFNLAAHLREIRVEAGADGG